jgi:hypothetical protein
MRRVQPWCRSSCTLIPVWCSGNCARLCARELHKLVRRHARALRTELVRLGDECSRYRSSGAALCCGLIHQHRFVHPSPIVVTYALVVAVPCARNGAGRLAICHSFESQTVWSVLCRPAHSAVQGRASSARGCRFRLQRECTSDVRTFKLRPCPGCSGGHGIVATLG